MPVEDSDDSDDVSSHSPPSDDGLRSDDEPGRVAFSISALSTTVGGMTGLRDVEAFIRDFWSWLMCGGARLTETSRQSREQIVGPDRHAGTS